MSIDALNDKIQKQQERLKQLKAQKLALEAKEKKAYSRAAAQRRYTKKNSVGGLSS